MAEKATASTKAMGRPSKLTVGGAGAVGTAVAYSAAISGVARSVALYDINGPKVRADALDIAHVAHEVGVVVEAFELAPRWWLRILGFFSPLRWRGRSSGANKHQRRHCRHKPPFHLRSPSTGKRTRHDCGVVSMPRRLSGQAFAIRTG